MPYRAGKSVQSYTNHPSRVGRLSSYYQTRARSLTVVLSPQVFRTVVASIVEGKGILQCPMGIYMLTRYA